MKINNHSRIRERIDVELREVDHKAAQHSAQRRKVKGAICLLEISDDLAIEKLRVQAYEEAAVRKDGQE